MIIRAGEIEDLPRVLQLIQELATFEQAPEEVNNTLEMLTEDGFGNSPCYGLYVAEKGNHVVGISLFYYRYSTWKGKKLYLEDLIVTESERGNGIGGLLFDKTVEHAKEHGCRGMNWQVLGWNERAIQFYTEKYKADLDDEWINCSIEF